MEVIFNNWKQNKRGLQHIADYYKTRDLEIPKELSKTDFPDAKDVARKLREFFRETKYIVTVRIHRYKVGYDYIMVRIEEIRGEKYDQCFEKRLEFIEKYKHITEKFTSPAVRIQL